MVLANTLLMPAELKIVILRKPAEFWKIFRDIMVSRHEVIANNMTHHSSCHLSVHVCVSHTVHFIRATKISKIFTRARGQLRLNRDDAQKTLEWNLKGAR